MLESISLQNFSKEEKELLLKELGFSSDGVFVLNLSGEKVIDTYIDEPVTMENMLILPGSTLIIDNNPLSIASYLQEHPNVL